MIRSSAALLSLIFMVQTGIFSLTSLSQIKLWRNFIFYLYIYSITSFTERLRLFWTWTHHHVSIFLFRSYDFLKINLWNSMK
jgi:hypothetical protein